MGKRLVVSDGSRERELMVVGRLVVGRDPACDITYDDALLSRRHAEFVASGDEVVVRDLGSRNGVFVNGARIAERTLRSGDIVQVGPVRARYIADTVPVSTAPEEVDAEYTAVLRHDSPAPAPPASAPARPPAAAAVAVAPSVAPLPRPPVEDNDRTRMIPGPRPQAEPAKPAAAQPVGDDEERTQFLRSPGAPPRPAPSSAEPPVSTPETNSPAPSSVQPRAAAASEAVRDLAETKDADELSSATVVFAKPPSARPRATPAPASAPEPSANRPAAAAAQPAPVPQPPTVPPPAVTPQPAAPQATAAPQPAPVPKPAAIRQPAANPQSVVNPQSAVRNPSLDPARDTLSVSRRAQLDASLSSYVVVQAMVLAIVVLVAAAIPLMMWRSAPEEASLVWLAVPVAVAAIAAYWIGAQIKRRVADAFAAVERDRR